jgi:hypothetical protein
MPTKDLRLNEQEPVNYSFKRARVSKEPEKAESPGKTPPFCA